LSSEEQKWFCLSIADWCPCDDCQSDESMVEKPAEESAVTNGKKALKLKPKTKVTTGKPLEPSTKMMESVEPSNKKRSDVSQRFSFEVTSDELEKLKEGECSANTLKSTITRNKRCYIQTMCALKRSL